MSFTDFITKFEPTFKLHTTGKSFCIETMKDIPNEFKKSLIYDELNKKIHWNNRSTCWFSSLDNEAKLLEYGLKRTDTINEEKDVFLKEKEAFENEKKSFLKEKEAFEIERNNFIDTKCKFEITRTSINTQIHKFLKDKETFEQEKKDFEADKEKYIDENQYMKNAKKLVNKIKSYEDEIKKLKNIITNSDVFDDTEIAKKYTTILSFIRFAYKGGIEKGVNPDSRNAIHDIKLLHDTEKDLFVMKYQKMKNNELCWEYDTDAMYLPKLRK
jgi:hypothetical protein